MTPNQPNPKDPIDQILQALAHTETPTGMDNRILKTLELHASAELESRLRARVHPCRKWAQMIPALAAEVPVRLARSLLSQFAFAPALVALTTAAAAILLVLSAIQHPRHSIPSPRLTASTDSGQRSTLTLQPPILIPRTPRPERTTQNRQLRTDNTQRTTLNGQPPPTSASFPAPPMPLTDQEKLLLRIAHRDAPQALAALTPETFAAEQAQDKAAFEAFFPPPVVEPTDLPTPTPEPVIPSGDKK